MSLNTHKNFRRILTGDAGAPVMRRVLSHLPLALKTPGNLALLEIYFLIPQASVRRFVLRLFANITNDVDGICLFGDLSEAEYLLAHNALLPTEDARDKMLALVRQVCTANRGDMGHCV